MFKTSGRASFLIILFQFLQYYIFVVLSGDAFALFIDKSEYQVNIFFYLHKNVCWGYSLQAPRQGASDEYPQHVFVEK